MYDIEVSQHSQHTWIPKLAWIKTRVPSKTGDKGWFLALRWVSCVSHGENDNRGPALKGILFTLHLKKKRKKEKTYVVQKMSISMQLG